MKDSREEDLSDDKISKDRNVAISLDQLEIEQLQEGIKKSN
jgi:hypothetical protein